MCAYLDGIESLRRSVVQDLPVEGLVRPGRFERPTFCSGGKRSIQLSYGRTWVSSIVEQSAASVVILCGKRPIYTPERWLSGRKQRFAKPS